MALSPSTHFDQLGAPLTNKRWSWGSQTSDGTVIVRAWDDEIEQFDGNDYIRLTNRESYEGGRKHPGYEERLRHIQAIKSGKPAYAVICTAHKALPRQRRIKSFDQDGLTKIIGLREIRGDTWGHLGDRVGLGSIKSTR